MNTYCSLSFKYIEYFSSIEFMHNELYFNKMPYYFESEIIRVLLFLYW